MNDEMNMAEFMRLSKLFKGLGYTGDQILKAFEYVESGDEKTLSEFLTETSNEINKDSKKELTHV
ncbi:MAG: hypothetical protein NC120_00055 [Ruminococcus sp.]|nr:hypothetical protein [Ruminococcus sp.]